MAENPNQAKNYDAVLGGTNPPPINAAVLGGIEGLKKRLASPIVEGRIALLKEALKYGEAGLDLVLQALHDESMSHKFAAYSLLQDRQEPRVKQQLDNFIPSFEFETVTVNRKGQRINRYRHKAQFFTENLGNGVLLEMVLIRGGTFLMGSPEIETERLDWESPQHPVTVKPFFIGKYPVTQAQWKAVATLPQINISLNSYPSCFKGPNRPVETVSWYEAQEFCARLSQKTGLIYRLPSEAEWEYACRAKTTTPFHFGETITDNLANYYGNYTYADEPKGIYRVQTTDVGIFPPNAFGLYDMHGNVWEWCGDFWHEYGNGAAQDSTIWNSGGYNSFRLLRGGSWVNLPSGCRSAYRNHSLPETRNLDIGFRVGCAIA